ncbi:MAG: MtrB/PioB family outer membrane beta-barrel protein [Bryobacteraceae bacterium]|jgi:hypothetical protein
MKLLLSLAFILPLAAQQPPTPPAAPPAAPAAAATPAAPATPAEAPAATSVAAPAPSPVPSAENWFTGYIELGYRFTGIGGSLDTYRSIVDLGAGPKLIGADFTILDPKHRLFDRLRVRAYDWGDDPYESLHVFAEKLHWYEFQADYRRVAYFSNVPSFANPLLGQAGGLDEQSFDTRRTLGSFSLNILPEKWISPYLDYDRDSSTGSGVTVFESSPDSLAVPDKTDDSTNLYRGGVQIKGRRFHITLEEGGTTFRNDQDTYATTGNNPGNDMAPVFGDTLGLTGLVQAYGIRGTSTFSKAIITANPFSWLDIYAHFLYSEPKDTVNYTQFNTGNFVLESQVLLYTGEQYLAAASAVLPHTSANIGWEIRPLRRIRILQSWSTDRLHNSGSAAETDTLLAIGSSNVIADALQSSLATNYSQADTSILAEVSRSVNVRGGYRYVWGDASDAVLPAEGLITISPEFMHRQVGMGALTWRPAQKLSFTGEFEIGSSGGAYFRTSLYNYKKARAMGRYQLLSTLHLSGDYNVLSNKNPTLDESYKFLVHQESAALTWTPKGKKFDIEGSYEHCGYHSQIGYLIPQLLTSAESIYTENCHTISALFNLTYKRAKLSAGGSAVLTSGSQPTTYYQPVAKATVSLTKNLGFFAEWRYYGFGEAFYMYESFRANTFTLGLRFTR